MTYTLKNIAAAVIVACVMPATASAQCFADYKAKQTSGELRLHYGVIELADMYCADRALAAGQVQMRIESDGWTLLRIMSFFDSNGLDNKRADAGEYFLRY
jgi:hypothetical protein